MPGSRVAAAVTDHLVRAIRSTRVEMAPHTVSLAMAMQEAFFNLTGTELRNSAGPLLRTLTEHPEMDPDLGRLLGFVGRGKGQLATLLGTQVLGAAVGTGLGALLGNLFQPVTGRLVAANPHLPISTADAAHALATGLGDPETMRFDAHQQGLDDHRTDVLIDLSRPRPTPDMIFAMLNRGSMDGSVALDRMRKLGYTDDDIRDMWILGRAEIDPARLADAVTFGAIAQDEATRKAAHGGMTAEDFDLLVRANGMPPATEQLAFALRRGVIDHATFVRGLTQGPLRNEWIPLVERMVLEPMSIADAIEAAAKGHLPEDQAKAIALQNGLEPEHYQPLRDSAGEPLGVQQMTELYNRGVMTRDELVQGIRESRLMNKYIPFAMAFAEKLPPERTVVSLVTKGSITPEQGLTLLLKLGYTHDIAQAMMDEAHAAKHEATRSLSQSQIVALYRDRTLTRDQAAGLLEGLRYSAEDAAWLLGLADLARAQKFTDAAISFVHSSFRTRRIDEHDASATLDGLRVPPDQRDDLIALWTLERTVATKELTLAQLHAAAKAGLIASADYTQRILGMGYGQEDADILTALYAPPPAA